jgi:magnesium-transporting ATPase (P-type)
MVLERITNFAEKALRCICIAYKDLKEGECGLKHDAQDKGDVLFTIEKSGRTSICILGIKDIIRPEVPLAIE